MHGDVDGQSRGEYITVKTRKLHEWSIDKRETLMTKEVFIDGSHLETRFRVDE